MSTVSESLDERLGLLFRSDREAIADPFPLFSDLCEAGPVVVHGPVTLVTQHAEAKAVLRDNSAFSNGASLRGSRADDIRAQLAEEHLSAFEEVFEFQALFFNFVDGDAHTRLRRIAHHAFTPRRIAELTAATELYIDRVLSELAQNDASDLMELAYRVPLMIIGDLLGVPPEDHALIKGWSDKWARNRVGIEPGPLLEAHTAMREFRAYVKAMIDEHRRHPSPGDLVGALLDAEQGDRLSADELVGMFFVLLFAGHETTTSLIGGGMLELLRHRAQWEKLCADPGLAASATEELLRWVTPVQWVGRVTNTEIDIAGSRIAADTTVLAMLACANRDPAAFTEADSLEITRSDSGRHLSLGFGTHFCLGASLARLEGMIACRELATRFPAIELDAVTVDFGGNAMLRRPVAVPVILDPDQRPARK